MKAFLKRLNTALLFWMLFFFAAYIPTGNAYMQLPVVLLGCAMFFLAMPLKQTLHQKALLPVAALLISAACSILSTRNIEPYYVVFLFGYIGASYYISTRQKTGGFYKWLLIATVLYYSLHYLCSGTFSTLYNLASENTVTIYLITLYYLYAREGRKIGREPSLILAGCCCLLGILSHSRTGMVCGAGLFMGVTMIRLSGYRTGKIINKAIVAIGFSIAAIALIFFAPQVFDILYDPPRMYMWKLYWSKISNIKAVLLGGAFIGEGAETIIAYHGNLHNTFLNIHARYGLIALFSVLWMIAVGLKKSLRSKDWCGALCLLLYVLRSLTDNTSLIGAMDFLLFPMYFTAVLPQSNEEENPQPKVLFLINTIPQIINCATLCSTKFRSGYQVTICLMDSLYQRFGEALSASPLFNRVTKNTWVETGVKKGSRNFRRICDLLDYYRIESCCQDLEDDYDIIFAAGPNLRNLELYYYLNRRHPANLVFFEEGIAEYHFLAHERPASERLASLLVFGSYYKENITGVYVYAPYLALHNNTIPFHEIPVPTGKAAEELNALIACMFPDLSQCSDLSGKVVYLDQPYDIDAPGSFMHLRTEEVVKALRSLFGDENICIKLHPRSKPEKYGNSITYLPQSIPFEVLYDAVRHQECILLSVCSSAALNVMLKYGTESHALLLYRIVIPEDTGGLFVQLVNRFNSYANQNGSREILMPKSLDELEQLLSSIQTSLH